MTLTPNEGEMEMTDIYTIIGTMSGAQEVDGFIAAVNAWDRMSYDFVGDEIYVFDEYGEEVPPEVLSAYFETDEDWHDDPPMSLDDLAVLGVASESAFASRV